MVEYGLPWWLSGKESACQCRRHGFDPWVGKMPWRRKWQPIPVFLSAKVCGQRNLVGYISFHRVGDAIQPSHPLLPASPLALNLSQHQSLFQRAGSLHPHGLYSPWNSAGQNIGVGSLSLLQGIFPIQGSNPGFPHFRSKGLGSPLELRRVSLGAH